MGLECMTDGDARGFGSLLDAIACLTAEAERPAWPCSSGLGV